MNRENEPGQSPIYSKLAHVYDTLMADVDYEAWGDYLDDIIQLHAPDTESILELGCGTGSMALSLDELECYQITATDLSPEMIRVAREKAGGVSSRIDFRVMNFLDIDLPHRFDLVLLIFDSINYILDHDELVTLFRQVEGVLKPGGHFLFDFTTPRHSRKSIYYLDGEEGVANGYRYKQSSRYDHTSGIHTNQFRIEARNDRNELIEAAVERHLQRPYTLDDMTTIVRDSGFKLLDSYDSFTLEPGHEQSLRITIMSQCPNRA